jgi:fumarate reductase flavoprotein subunit
LNKDGSRYLQDYGLGPPGDKPRNKYMELGPRDRLSQAYWHEKQKGRTLSDPRWGSFVHLDLRHLGEACLRERLPQIYELALHYLGVDPAKEPIPVLPAVHYTMGGILADGNTAAPLAGLYSVGECSSVGIHGANRLGSNSLTELCVFGKTAGVQAAQYARSHDNGPEWNADAAARDAIAQAESATTSRGSERIATIRKEMAQAMENGCGIYRTEATMRAACDKLAELKQRYKRLKIEDTSRAWNTERLTALELGYLLDVAQAMAHSALERRESRGSHQRLDGYTKRDDANFLKHSLATYRAGDAPAITYGPVKITRSQPGKRVYGAAGEKADAERHEKEAADA